MPSVAVTFNKVIRSRATSTASSISSSIKIASTLIRKTVLAHGPSMRRKSSPPQEPGPDRKPSAPREPNLHHEPSPPGESTESSLPVLDLEPLELSPAMFGPLDFSSVSAVEDCVFCMGTDGQSHNARDCRLVRKDEQVDKDTDFGRFKDVMFWKK